MGSPFAVHRRRGTVDGGLDLARQRSSASNVERVQPCSGPPDAQADDNHFGHHVSPGAFQHLRGKRVLHGMRFDFD
jgi:hypothetical protein